MTTAYSELITHYDDLKCSIESFVGVAGQTLTRHALSPVEATQVSKIIRYLEDTLKEMADNHL